MILAEILENNQIVISEIKNTDAVSDSVLFETVSFKFPESWNNYAKTVVFTADSQTVNVLLSAESDLCISENECYIPHEVLKGDSFYLSAFGVKGDSIATSTKAEIEILESGYALGEAPEEPTPTVYQQLIDLTEAVKMIAESVRNDADNGVFKGETGEKGDKGEQGEKGDKGDKGDKGEPGNIVNIDQTYNPASENALSGKAVASAVANHITPESNTEWIFDGGDASGAVEIDIVVDGEMSDTSDNPISNKVVKNYIDSNVEEVNEKINYIDSNVEEVNEKINYIDSNVEEVNKKFNSIADYIVEQGKSGIWTYRKWASGEVDLWGMATLDKFGDDRYIYKSEKLPFALTAVPIVDMTIYNAESAMHKQGAMTTYTYGIGTSSIKLAMIKDDGGLTSGNTTEVSVSIKGRWE